VEELRVQTALFVRAELDQIAQLVQVLLDPTALFAQVLLDQNAANVLIVRHIPIVLLAVREEVKVEKVVQDQQAADVQTAQVAEMKVVTTRNVQNQRPQHAQSVRPRRRKTRADMTVGKTRWDFVRKKLLNRRNLCVTKMRQSLTVRTHVSV
jgi:hypothetical protein